MSTEGKVVEGFFIFHRPDELQIPTPIEEVSDMGSPDIARHHITSVVIDNVEDGVCMGIRAITRRSYWKSVPIVREDIAPHSGVRGSLICDDFRVY